MTTQEPSTPTEQSEASKPGKQRGPWLRRLRNGVLLLLALVFLLRITHGLWLPPLVDKLASGQGFKLSYEDLDLSVTGGRLELKRVVVFPLASAEAEGDGDGHSLSEEQPLAAIDYLGLDLDVSALFTGRLRVHRAEIDGIAMHVERNADGIWNFSDRGAADAPDGEIVAAEDAVEEEQVTALEQTPQSIDFSLPFELDAAVVHGVRLTFRDAFVDPPLDTELVLDVAARDLGHDRLPARISVKGWSPGLIDALRIEIQAEAGERLLNATGSLELEGLGIANLAPYLREIGLRPNAEALHIRGGFNAQLAPLTGTETDLGGTLQIGPLSLHADQGEALALDAVNIRVARASTHAAHVEEIELQGLRGRASRDRAGILCLAGLELHGVPGEKADTPSPASEEPSKGSKGASPFALEIGRVALLDAQFLFGDEGVVPAANLALGLQAEVQDIVLDAARPGLPFTVALGLALDGSGELRVQGSVVPSADKFALDLTFTGSQLSGDSLVPYLAAAGLEPTIEAGHLEFPLHVETQFADGLGASVSMGPLRFSDGEQELLALEELSLADINVAQSGDVDLGVATLSGLRLGASLQENGGVRVLGLRTIPSTPPPIPATNEEETATVVASAPDGEQAESKAAARLHLNRLALEDCVIGLKAEHLEPALDLNLETALSLDNLVLGGSEGDAPVEPARLSLQLRSEDFIETMSLGGSLLSRPGPLDLELELALEASGMRAAAMEGLLAQMGLEPNLSSGSMAANVTAAVRSRGQDLEAQFELSNLTLKEESVDLLGLGSLRIDGLRLTPEGNAIASVQLTDPWIQLGRSPDGALELPGLRIPATPPSKPAQSDAQAAPPEAPPEAPPATAQVESPEPAKTPLPFALGNLAVSGASVRWHDAAFDPPVDLDLRLSAKLAELDTAPGAAPMNFKLGASLGDVLEDMVVAGQASLDPAQLNFDLRLLATGLRAGSLTHYLPPGMEVKLTNGQFGLNLRGSSVAHGEGGRALALELTELELQDAGEVLLALEALRIDAPRFDPLGASPTSLDSSQAQEPGAVFDLEAVTLDGLALRVEQTQAGLEFLGLRLVPQKVGLTEEQIQDPVSTPSEADAEAELIIAGDPTARVGVGRAPTLRLGTLRVGVSQLTFVDRVAGGEPLELAFFLQTDEPQVLCSPDPEDLPPLRFSISGTAAPLLDSLWAKAELSPYGGSPRIVLDMGAEGLHGAQLTRVLPGLAETIDASEWEDGSLGAQAEIALAFVRRGPLDFNLARGFAAELAVTEVALRPTPDADAVFGFDRLDIDLQRFQPATGELRIKSIELSGTRARMRQEEQGLRVAGVLLMTPEQEDPIEVIDETDTVLSTEIADAQLEEAAPDATPGPEMRVDAIFATGLDFIYEDVTVDPPFLFPLTDMELEVKGLSTRALQEPRAVSFRALLDAGEIPLKERSAADNLLSGVLGSLSEAVSFGDNTFELESRRLWDQFEVSGRVALFPEPKGRVDLVLNGLELPAFGGLARDAGVEIGDGLLDSKLALRLRGTEGIGVDLHTTLDVLSLSEPADGPISQYLKLPAPLDTVLFLLRNDKGQQDIPLRMTVPAEGLSAGSLVGAVANTLGTLVLDALSSAPARLLGPLTGLVGQLGLIPEPPTAETVSLSYPAGTSLPANGVAELLNPLMLALRADPNLRVVLQHELGKQDIALAERLANPDPERGLELVTRLRDRKAAISRERSEVAALLRAQWAIGLTAEAVEQTARLKHLDREAFGVEDALDRVLELMRPGAERRRGRRTRLAALALAGERMRLLEEWILQRGGRGLASQIDIRRPRFDPVGDGEEERLEGSVSFTPQPRR